MNVDVDQAMSCRGPEWNMPLPARTSIEPLFGSEKQKPWCLLFNPSKAPDSGFRVRSTRTGVVWPVKRSDLN